MPTQVTNYKCPACGGPLHYVGASGKLECDYCGSSYEVAQVEAMFAQQNQTAAATAQEVSQKADADGWNTSGFTEDWGTDAGGMKTYSCPSCGAELICDGNTAATCCPYCGNQTVIPGQFSGSLKPEFVIPFKTDKEGAKRALRNHYQGKTLLPRSFVDGNHIEDIQGVYVPFWMFDCQATGDLAYDATISTVQRQGDKEITTTKYFDVRRSGSLSFEKVPVDASTRMPDGHMDSIEPFDYRELKPFSMAYMPGFLADKYDVEAEECGKRMQERCEKTFIDEVGKTVTGYNSVSERGRSVTVRKGAVHYAMLPVWLLATKWNGQNFLFAMNGQSGKLVGDLPMDKGKYWGFFAGISAVLIALLQVFNNFLAEEPMTGGTMIAVTVVLPLLIALIVVSILKGQLRSVTSQRAAAYIAGSGLKLSRRDDRHVDTKVTTRIIEQKKS